MEVNQKKMCVKKQTEAKCYYLATIFFVKCNKDDKIHICNK